MPRRMIRSEGITKKWLDPEFRAMMSDNMAKLWQDPEFRAMMSENMAKLWLDPEFQETMANISRLGPSKGEAEVRRVLTEVLGCQEYTDFITEMPIPNTVAHFDFYLINENLIIEVHDNQHNDQWKKEWARANGFGYAVIPHRNKTDFDNIEDTLVSLLS